MSGAPLPRHGQRIAVRYADLGRDPHGTRHGELIGIVESLDEDGLVLRDRRLQSHTLALPTLISWRQVPQVPRGRDPLTADRSLLDRMATDAWLHPDLDPDSPDTDIPDAEPPATETSATKTGPVQVARLCELLGPEVPQQSVWDHDHTDPGGGYRAALPGARAISVTEWATIVLDPPALSPLTPGGVDAPSEGAALQAVRQLARWAAFRDARNVQVRGWPEVLPGLVGLDLVGLDQEQRISSRGS